MRRRMWSLGVFCAVVSIILAACGSNSGSEPTAEITATDAFEPTGESSTVAVGSDSAEDETVPEWSPYAEGEPTPTVISGAQCSYSDSAQLEFQNFEEMRAELHACNAEFAWPSGYEIDVEEFVSIWGSDSGGEVGISRTIIIFNNTCAWMTAWLDYRQAGELEMADKALRYMESTLPYWRIQGPPDPAAADPIFQEPIDKAKLGDPSGFLAWLNGLDCSTYKIIRVDS